jgi:glutamate formiminotransferase / 5-formyltetrahydrofolate cyclo-ligase
MSLITVPNVSEGRDLVLLETFTKSIHSAGARVLDVHSDAVHNRSVLTSSGADSQLIDGMTRLARACLAIDFANHRGVHPRLGPLDVCPFVPVDSDIEHATDVARRAAPAIAEATDLPVYLYGAAAHREETRSLPGLRRGGLEELAGRAADGLVPDAGPTKIDMSRGVICVGARPPLIAFNVWLRGSGAAAEAIAARVRTRGGGPHGVRALGWSLSNDLAQVSMNLTAPDETGIDRAFDEVAGRAVKEHVEVVATELVGLVPDRYLPAPDKEAARLLIEPGRSLETALRS